MAASITAVRGRPAAPDPTGVAWVSTTLPVPSPSTMRMTTVRDREGFKQAHRAGPLITYLMRYAAARCGAMTSPTPSVVTSCVPASRLRDDTERHRGHPKVGE